MPRADAIGALEGALGHTFENRALLVQSITHPSYAHEHPELVNGDNQRLEFLGDAVLGLAIARELYNRFPRFAEGQH